MVAKTQPPAYDKAPTTNGRGHARSRSPGSFSSIGRAWRSLVKRIPELRDDVAWYATAQSDRARLLLTQLVTRAAVGALKLIAVSAIFTISVAFVLSGAADGMAVALGGRAWLANLITGTATLMLLFGALAFAAMSKRSKRLAELQRRYRRHEARSSQTADGGAPTEVNHVA